MTAEIEQPRDVAQSIGNVLPGDGNGFSVCLLDKSAEQLHASGVHLRDGSALEHHTAFGLHDVAQLLPQRPDCRDVDDLA